MSVGKFLETLAALIPLDSLSLLVYNFDTIIVNFWELLFV